ncbi:DUF1269 domain-containing protein [Massilia sp. TS11]|uniref:DUF1269 domain-containing protein n=1 Tax=Massilia sp. TS11 TaxID=2908003 RepID=UPI001EDB902B|nr:DUF1269 domain-containing protein [Massilia sp. TS11]MCG2585079.1 DUF1269 domain-containing protein [Massilia sp. TS11]
MRRRLYYMLPDIPSARAMLDALLLARIEERHMHFIAQDGSLPADMPDGTIFDKTDIVHGAQLGTLIGGGAGLLAGALMVAFPPEGISLQTMAVLATGVGGAAFGAWASGMTAAAAPNSRLEPFRERIEQGQVLLILDVPHGRVAQLEAMLAEQHPEAAFGGQDAHVPAFP